MEQIPDSDIEKLKNLIENEVQRMLVIASIYQAITKLNENIATADYSKIFYK